MTCASASSRRASAVLRVRPGVCIRARTNPGSRWTAPDVVSVARLSTGLLCRRRDRSMRRRGSANTKFCVYSRRIRMVRAWLLPPSTSTLAFV